MSNIRYFVTEDDGFIFIVKLTEDASKLIEKSDFDSVLTEDELKDTLRGYVDTAAEEISEEVSSDEEFISACVNHYMNKVGDLQTATTKDIGNGWIKSEEKFTLNLEYDEIDKYVTDNLPE